MKKNRLIIMLIIALILLTFVSITVYATYKNIDSIFNIERYITRSSVKQTKVFTLETKNLPQVNSASVSDSEILEYKSKIRIAESGTVLNYKETVNYAEDLSADVYIDSNGNEYSYDMQGNFDGFCADISVASFIADSIKQVTLTDEQASQIAKKYAVSLLGDELNDFETKNVSYDQYGNIYKVTLVKKFGEGNFIIGPWCFVDILPDGSLLSCTSSRLHLFDDFDFTKLDGITASSIEEFINKQVYSKYSQNVTYETDNISLIKKGEKFYIYVIVNFNPSSELPPEKTGEEYYYELD